MKTNQQTNTSNVIQKPWWNRPLWGERTLIEAITASVFKELIPESTIFLHDRALGEVSKIAPSIERLHDEKFGSPEFILLLDIRSSFLKGIQGYEGLEESSEILKVALEAKDSFLKIEATEFKYRSSNQQKLYEEVFNLLSQNITKQQFQEQVQLSAQNTVPKLKTEEGKNAIEAYSQELKSLASNHELGLRLLYLFKQSDLADFSVLKKISELVTSFKKEELHNYKQILVEVKLKYELFEKLGHIIKVPEKQNNPDTYAKIIQYIALMNKHQNSYIQFEQLLYQLDKWETPYQTLKTLREEYPKTAYKQPKSFREKIPAFPLYQQYKPWLGLRKGK